MSKTSRGTTKSDEQSAVKRVVIEFSQRSHAQLWDLKERSGASTLAELVRKALKLFEFFVIQREEGWTVQLTKNGETRQVEILL
jgi:hypothetical protein